MRHGVGKADASAKCYRTVVLCIVPAWYMPWLSGIDKVDLLYFDTNLKGLVPCFEIFHQKLQVIYWPSDTPNLKMMRVVVASADDCAYRAFP